MMELSRPIHITALAPYKIFPARMGGQKGIALFYAYLAELMPVTLVSTKNNELPHNASFSFLPVLSNARLRYANPFLFFFFKRIIKQNRSTHFIVEHPYFGWLGILLKKFCRLTLIVHSHNIESVRFKSIGKWWWKLLWYYERYVYRRADHCFFVTEEDRQYAVMNYRTVPEKCHVASYGIEQSKAPTVEERLIAKRKIRELYGINDDEKILFFNGTLSYKPNLDAVEIILTKIDPALKQQKDFRYRILISGIGLPAHYRQLVKSGDSVIYTGFVDDINSHFKAADIFINPVSDGGGIKTKLVEALANDVNAVSTISGAFGIPAAVTGEKMSIVADGDWNAFINAVLKAGMDVHIPQRFFDQFYWGNIAKKILSCLQPDK